jgi:hypothetical protein
MIPSLVKQQPFMIRNFIAASCALALLASCSSYHPPREIRSPGLGNETYQPVTKPEQIEFNHDQLDIYPDDLRSNASAYLGKAVVWAGIIHDTSAQNNENDTTQLTVDTIFEHHYFNGTQYDGDKHVKLLISPRGEGLFRTRWHLNRIGSAADVPAAEKYSAPGKLALVYGVPESIDGNGTIVLKYRFLRILDTNQFSTNQFDYGRLGQPFRALPPPENANLSAR